MTRENVLEPLVKRMPAVSEDTPKDQHKWPDREGWAKHRRAPYGDRFDALGVSLELADYATPEEVEAIVVALKALYTDEGRKLREGKTIVPLLIRQPGETNRHHTRRWCAMTESERGMLDEKVTEHEDNRQQINLALKQIGEGRLPDYRIIVKCVLAPFATLMARYKAAYDAAWVVREQEILATPIDDEAWEQELRHREEIDAYFDA
jgi:hypothetical protein